MWIIKMILTKEYIDTIAPIHSRTSCNDNSLNNAYGGWNGKYDPNTGKKEIIYPRCSRCYLLNNIGLDTESLNFKIDIWVNLKFKGE